MPGPCGYSLGKIGGVGHPKPRSDIKPPHPHYYPSRKTFISQNTPFSPMRNNPKTRNNSTELIPLIKPVDTPSAYPLPATTPQKQGQERNPIRYSSATELIPPIKPVDSTELIPPIKPVDRVGDYNAPFTPLDKKPHP